MKFYIGSHDKPQAVALTAQLTAAGHQVTARWVAADDSIHAATDHDRVKRCVDNLEDLMAADAMIVIAAPPGELVPGGKHFEAGYAVAIGKKLLILGRRENLYHAGMPVYADVASLLAAVMNGATS